ncbi:MAG TPA: 2'-5' RNA ligase family protein [Dehalococcoidia bacterium]|nr:2'-5' RNA ligase family protein [Dehalococcoidia bacterium]
MADPPIFSSFDEAWAWFTGGGRLVTLEAQRERLLRGRAQLLVFEAPLGELPVADEIAELQDELADIDGLDLMPEHLLHVSIRALGFQVIAKSQPGDVLPADVARASEMAARALRGTAPMELRLGPVNVFPDALVLQVEPIAALRDLLVRLEAVGEPDAFPYPVERYLPHCTIAMFRTPGVGTSLRERLPALRGRAPYRATVQRVELARFWFVGEDATAWPERETVRPYVLR